MEDIEKRLQTINLFEKYGNLLSQSQKQALQLHLIEDLSYSEMSEIMAMTRAGAYDAVKKGISKLIEIDKKMNK